MATIGEHEQQQETLALLALGKKEFQEGRFSDAEAFLDTLSIGPSTPGETSEPIF